METLTKVSPAAQTANNYSPFITDKSINYLLEGGFTLTKTDKATLSLTLERQPGKFWSYAYKLEIANATIKGYFFLPGELGGEPGYWCEIFSSLVPASTEKLAHLLAAWAIIHFTKTN